MAPAEYAALIRAFVSGAMPVDAFEQRFLAARKAETELSPPVLGRILDALFGDVDAYTPDCQPDEENWYTISEQTLRIRAAEALQKINAFLAEEDAVHASRLHDVA